jgi:hypothetical protein
MNDFNIEQVDNLPSSSKKVQAITKSQAGSPAPSLWSI